MQELINSVSHTHTVNLIYNLLSQFLKYKDENEVFPTKNVEK